MGGRTWMDRVQSNTSVNMWAVTRKLNTREPCSDSRRLKKKKKEKERKRRKREIEGMRKKSKKEEKCETPMQRRPYTVCSV